MRSVLTSIDSLSVRWRHLIVFILGIIAAGAMPPFHLLFLLPLSFTGLLLILSGAKNKKQAFLMGWLFGWGYFIAGLYWIGIAFTIDADAHAALIPLPVLGLPAFLGIFIGLVTLLTHQFGGTGLRRVLFFSLTWTSMEVARSYLFTGFPWNLIGYSWLFSPQMSQLISVVGTIGVSFLTMFLCALPLTIFSRDYPAKRKATLVACALSVLGAQYGYGALRLENSSLALVENARLRIVQPNIRQQDKWKRHLRPLHVKKLVSLSLSPGIEEISHIIWPETAIPYFLTTNQKVADYVRTIIPAKGALIAGAPRRALKQRLYWNSLHVMSPDGKFTDIYDKQHLVPYGEYMPLRSILDSLGIINLIPALDKMSDFNRSDDSYDEIVAVPGLPDARGLICYEVAFATEIDSGKPFDWILNLTNDGWFGDTTGPYQHLVTTQARALEQGVPVVRAANTGISALIDPYGQISSRLDLNEAGILDISLPKALPDRPLFSFMESWLEIGLVFLNLLMLARLSRKSDWTQER